MAKRTFGYKAGVDKVAPKFAKKKLLASPILHSTGGEPEISVIVDKAITSTRLRALVNLLSRKGLTSYQILTPLRLEDVTEDDFKKGVTQIYMENSFDLTKYITPGSKIVSMGRAIHYLTRSADLDINTFYDHILWRTYFFDPIRQCRVYVTDSVQDVVGKDSFENYHAGKVFEQAVRDTYVVDKTPHYQVIVENTEMLKQMFHDHATATQVAIDTETGGFDFLPGLYKRADEVLSLELSFDGITGYDIPWSVVEENKRAIQREIQKRTQLYTNGKFDAKFLYYNGFRRTSLHIDHDIIQIRHTVNEMSKLGLKPQSFLYTNFGGYDHSLDIYKKKNKVKSYRNIPQSLRGVYGADDATATFRCVEEGLKDLREMDRLFPNPENNGWNLERLYHEVRMPMLNNYLDAEIEGLYVDIDQLDIMSNEIKHRIYQATQDLYLALRIPKNRIDLSSLSYEETTDEVKKTTHKMVGLVEEATGDFINTNSNQQLGKYIEEELGWRIYERDSDGIANVNASTVARWLKNGRKEAAAIDKLSKLQTLYGTFVGERKGPKGDPTGFYQYLRKHDDGGYRVHANVSSLLAGSWRCKCRRPNAQNFPARGFASEVVRSYLTPKDATEYFASEDFSGIQLRWAGIITGDPVMRNIFLNLSGDMHSTTAFSVFGRSIFYREDSSVDYGYSLCKSTYPGAQKLTLEMFLKLHKHIKKLGGFRQRAKNVNFGFLFSLAAKTFALHYIKPEWEFKDVEDFITENNLQQELADNLASCGDVFDGLVAYYNKAKGYRRRPATAFNATEAVAYLKDQELYDEFEDKYGFEEVEKVFDAYMITVGEAIRKNFFETYKELATYGTNQMKKGAKQGYVRSIYGAFRRVPYLLHKGKDTDNKQYAGNEAICINSPIQNCESVAVSRWNIDFTRRFKAEGLKARAFMSIHDAFELYIPRTEVRQTLEITKACAEVQHPEYKGITLETEAGVADYWGTKGTMVVDYKGDTVSGWELWDLTPELSEKRLLSIESHFPPRT